MPFYGDELPTKVDPYRKMSFGRAPKVHESDHLRSQGNLTYLDFIRLLSALWGQAHPEIPLYATGPIVFPTYPCIVYSLEIRRPFENEPKFKERETIRTAADEDDVRIYGQRFNNIVAFQAITREDPQVVEELIETFEDFMIEYTSIFKQLGLSEIVYAQRMPDGMDHREGRSVIHRTVTYKIVTEKLIQSSAWKMKHILIEAQKFITNQPSELDPDDPSLEQATPHTSIIDNLSGT